MGGGGRLLEVRSNSLNYNAESNPLTMAISGKSYERITGEVTTVTASVEAGTAFIRNKGLLTGKMVIPQPRAVMVKSKI